MDIFKCQNILEFSDWLKTELDCKEYLDSLMKKYAYKCITCNHIACQVKVDFTRQCNICGYKEFATANTLFHKVKFSVGKAFFSYFEIAASTKSLSASCMGVRYGVTRNNVRFIYVESKGSQDL